jgi:hypothetical protein
MRWRREGRGTCGVVGGEERGAGKVGNDGGGTLLKGCNEEVAKGGGPGGEGATQHREAVGPGQDQRAVPRLTAAQPQRARASGAA